MSKEPKLRQLLRIGLLLGPALLLLSTAGSAGPEPGDEIVGDPIAGEPELKGDESDADSDTDDGGGGGDEPAENVIAAHDRSSPQYKKSCDDCHMDIVSRQGLDTSIATAHVAMFQFAPGKPRSNRQCVWCHRTVDLTRGNQMAARSQGNLRRLVNVTLCAVCHGPSGPGRQLYQTEVSRTDPDGPLLYDLLCAPCHGDLAQSEVRGESASEIQEAIEEDEGGMGPLNVLSTEQLEAIAGALAELGENTVFSDGFESEFAASSTPTGGDD